VLTSLVLGVLLTDLYAAALVLARSRVYRTRLYRPMLLNLALCALPLVVLLAGVLAAVAVRAAGGPGWAAWAVAGAALLVWLLLLPNAGYLVTELNLSHRKEGDGVPMWFDIVLVLTLAMAGVLTTVLNVLAVHVSYVVLRHGDRAAGLELTDGRVLVAVVLLLVSVGMYLGRYLRLNSWDVTHPAAFARRLYAHVVTERHAGALVGFCLTHTVFLALMYLVVAGPVIAGLVAAER
jgi:uncharacterized membrane protein